MPVGRLLAGAGTAALVIVALHGLAAPARAQDPSRYNCPDGFDWVRMSGTACVQQRSTLPTNGKIGYDGHALCVDPLFGVYETRRTTDGKGVPGNPATSYAFLLECLTKEEFDARQALAARPAASGGDVNGGVASLLAVGMGSLPPGELILLGALGSGALVFAAAPAIRRRAAAGSTAPASAGSDEPATGSAVQPVDAAAATEAPPNRSQDLERRAAELETIDRRLAEQVDTIRAQARANQVSLLDVIQLAGAASDMLAILPIPPAQVPLAIVSGFANMAGITADALEVDPTGVYRQTRELLGDVARLRGIIAGERDAVAAELRALATAPPASSPVPAVDPALLPDATLRTARDRAQADVGRLHDAVSAATDDAARLRGLQSVEDARVAALRDTLHGLDAGPDLGTARDGNTAVNVASGLDGVARMRQGQALEGDLLDTGRAVDQGFRSGAWVPLREARRIEAGVVGQAEAIEGAGRWAGHVGAVTGGLSAVDWWGARTNEEARVLIEQSIEGHQYLAGRLDQDVRTAETHLESLRDRVGDAVARRRALSAEIDLRAARGGHLLWSE